MKLKRLIVQGFKSFKDRTTIVFDDKITGVVGPNGCGKSNIVDALFWVMGEQSAKHLRGDSMKDLIFAGSSKYQPASWAEVSLVLENDTGKHIHIGNQVAAPAEIQMTRKLYRNGETDYRINGTPCRLKDIQEVFMDTGAGSKSYSIIAQGEINRLVQSKPEDRRIIIEEVAGITKYKMRKKDSLRKIEQTQGSLTRLSDLKTEISKNCHNLEAQAEKARAAKDLKAKIERHDLIVSSHQVFDIMKNYSDAVENLMNVRADLEKWKLEKEQIELDLEEERINQTELKEKVEDAQNEYNELSRNLAAGEERLKSMRNEVRQKGDMSRERSKEIEDIKADKENRLERLEALKLEKQELDEFGSVDHDVDEMKAKVESLKEELELKRIAERELADEIKSVQSEHDELDKTIFKNSSRLSEFARSLEDITAEIDGIEKQFSGVSSEIAHEREGALEAENEATRLSEEEKNLKVNLDALQEELRNLESELKNLTKDKITTESTCASLKEIASALDGVASGNSEFLNSEAGSGFNVLRNILVCEEANAVAVNALLRDLMDKVVAENNVDAFISWLSGREQSVGAEFLISKNNFIRRDEETIERLKLRCGEVIDVNDVITIDENFQNLKSIFADRYIVDNLNPEIAKGISVGFNFRSIVSRDGKCLVVNDGNALHVRIFGADENNGGALERNNRIKELESRAVELNERFNEVDTLVASKSEEVDDLKLKYEEVRSQAASKVAEAQVKRASVESKAKNFETTNTRLSILQNRKNEISTSRVELLENEDGLNKRLEDLKTKLEELTERAENEKTSIEDLSSTYEDERNNLKEVELTIENHASRVRSVDAQLEDVEGQIEKYEQKIVNCENLIAEYNEAVDRITLEAESLDEQNKNQAGELDDKKDFLGLIKDQLADLLYSMQDRDNQSRKLGRDINDAEKTINKLEMATAKCLEDEEFITRNTFEKYRVDLRQTIGQFLNLTEDHLSAFNDLSSMYLMETEDGVVKIPVEEYAFVRKYGQDIKDSENKLRNYKAEYGRLGEINWQAVDDYDREKARLEFLTEQETKLNESLADLQTAINHIDEKSTERFKQAFDAVGDRFEKVFPIIFGGGEAHLEITGDVNDIECGINIIAKPPGKKMQNINLMSGGEKAMTAVSLIFSIFLVKPSPFCLLDEVDAPLDDANVGRFNQLLKEMSEDSQFILITHNKKTMEMNNSLYGVTMQEPGVSSAVSVKLS